MRTLDYFEIDVAATTKGIQIQNDKLRVEDRSFDMI